MQSSDVHPQKRQRNELEATSCASERKPMAKRRKRFASGYSPGFWDTLSNVQLTRRALKEFDQRTASGTSDQPTLQKKSRSRSTRILRSTTKRIRQVVEQGGPDLSRLLGYAEMPRNNTTVKALATSPYSAEFEQKMIDNGVYPDSYEIGGQVAPEPANIEALKEMLSRSRESLSPIQFSDDDLKNFKQLNRKVVSESMVMSRILPLIAGSKDNQFAFAEDISFDCLGKFEEDLSTPKPDLYYGARPLQVHRQVRRDLQAAIVPSFSLDGPVVPNFFMEAKSTKGRHDIAGRQAMYNGAIGARAIHQLQNYGSSTTGYDGNAYTVSSTYLPLPLGALQIYATYPRSSAIHPGKTEYCMTLVESYMMARSRDDFVAGATAFRNAREWTRKQRDIHIANANAVAMAMSPGITGTSGKGKKPSLSAIVESEEPETPPDNISQPGSSKRHRSLARNRAPGPIDGNAQNGSGSRRILRSTFKG